MKSVLAVALLSLSECASTQAQRPLSARDAKALTTALEGKIPGEPVRCVSRTLLDNMLSVGDGILLYRVGRDLTYRNDLEGQCHGLSADGVPIFQTFGGENCRGDIVRIADRQTGSLRGSCVLGPFVPYRKPEK